MCIRDSLEIADEGFTPKPLTVDIVGTIGRKLTFKMVFLEGNIKAWKFEFTVECNRIIVEQHCL